MKSRITNKKLMIGLSTTLLLLITCALLLNINIAHQEFDSEKWKTSHLVSEENMSLRWNMMNSLRNNYKLVGMSKNDVIQLLGEPDIETAAEHIYSLGYTGTGINTGTLVITFSDQDRVSNILVWQG